MNVLRLFKQTAVLWSGRTQDKYGKPSFANQTEIVCRWEDRQEKFVDASKREVLSRSVVYVDREVLPGEYLWHGSIDDVPDNDPLLVPSAHEVRAVSAIPSVDARTILRKVWV